MRTTYNRQTRRATRCIRARSPRGHRPAISPRGAAVTARSNELAQVAARVAEELDLSADAIDNLLWGMPQN